MRGEDEALAGAGTIDEIDDVFRRLRNFRNIDGRNVSGLPGSKKFFELRSDFGERGVSHDEKRGVVGFVPGVVEFGEIGAGHFFDAIGAAGANEGFVVGMTFAEEERRQNAQAHGEGRDFFALDGGEAFLLQALEFFFGEGRMEDEVGVNIESLIHIDLEGVEIDGGSNRDWRRQ